MLSRSEEVTLIEDYHLFRADRKERWCQLARHLENHPDDLEIALANIDRWLERGRLRPDPLMEWRRRIHSAQSSTAAFRSLLDYLAADNSDSEPLKGCSPFVGILKDPA